MLLEIPCPEKDHIYYVATWFEYPVHPIALLMRNTQSMEFPVRYFTLKGKTRISVSEPNGIKLNLYSCNIDYLQKIVLFIILDIFKSIDYHCSEKHFLSDLPIQNQESLLLPVKMSIISPLQLLKLSF